MNKKDAPIASYVLFFSAFCDIMGITNAEVAL
jgi:hypothetical protein